MRLRKSLIYQFNRLKEIDLINISSLNFIGILIKSVVGLISVKVVAVLIGPVGVALTGQLQNLICISQPFSNLGMDGGVTKYIAEYKDNEDHKKQIISTSFWILLIGSLSISLILMLFAKTISLNVLGDNIYWSVIFILGYTTLFFALNTRFLAILNGMKKYPSIIKINIINSIINLFFSLILVYFFQVYGALLALATGQSVVFFYTAYFVSKKKLLNWSLKDWFYNFDKGSLKKLLKFTLMSIASILAVPLIQILIRKYLIENISLEAAGIWEGMNKISGIYLNIIVSTLTLYYLPRLSEIKNKIELKKEIFLMYKFLTPILLLSILIAFLLKNIIISILYSPDFYPMMSLFLPQLIGDFFKIISWILAYQMVAKAMIRLFISSEILFGLNYLLMSAFFIDRYGLIGVSYAYAINYFLYFLFNIYSFRKVIFVYE